MTWTHYQKLRAAARARIDQKLAALQPTGGNGVSIQGSTITVQGRRREDPPRKEDLGHLVVFTRLTVNFNGRIIETPWEFRAYQHRVYPLFLHSTWTYTQMLDFPDVITSENKSQYREITVEFKALSMPADFYNHEKGKFRVPLILVIEEYGVLHTQEEVVIATHRIRIGARGATRSWKPAIKNVACYLRAVALERG